MKKKILALCLVVALMATAIAGATLAYFTDYTDDVVNTFTVGNVDIKLDEADVDNSTEGEDRDIANTYDDIYPGQTLPKDPMVTVMKGSEPSYVRMFVTADVTALKAAFPEFHNGTYFELERLVNWNKTEWPCAGIVANNDGTATYEFRYHEVVAENDDQNTELKPLFTEVKIPDDATNDDLKALVGEDDKFAFSIYAEAIQEAGFNTADEAWAAFATQLDKTQQ